MAKLPKDIEKDLDGNFTFNKFGIVNLSALRARNKTTLSTAELKQAINERFAKEMVGGTIEYIGKEK
jgi:hypothetical protein